jgi:hypothetical protein
MAKHVVSPPRVKNPNIKRAGRDATLLQPLSAPLGLRMVGLNQRSLLSLLQRTPSSGDYVAASKKKWAASAVLFQIRKRTAKKPYLSGGLRELQQSLLILARSSYVCQQTSSRCPWPPLCLNQRLGSLWVASAISREPTLSFYAAAIIKKKNYVFTKIRSFSRGEMKNTYQNKQIENI